MKIIAKVAGISSIILLLILLSTDPQRLPSVALIVPFILIFIALLACIFWLLSIYELSGPKKIRAGLVGASIPVILLVLQSLGQLTVRDTVAIFMLFGITYFYVSRLGVQPTN